MIENISLLLVIKGDQTVSDSLIEESHVFSERLSGQYLESPANE